MLAAVLLPLPLNFANIIALPLLLGVGVSFNIYFVMNWRAGREAPLGSATARAVLFSALTTATAFGSLAVSHHPGTASMGTAAAAQPGLHAADDAAVRAGAAGGAGAAAGTVTPARYDAGRPRPTMAVGSMNRSATTSQNSVTAI